MKTQFLTLICCFACTWAAYGQKTWLGSSNDNWHTAANWSPSGAPNNTHDVVIGSATNQPRIFQNNAVCRNITFNSGGTLLISAGRTLSVFGTTFINNSGDDDVLFPGGLGVAWIIFANTGGGTNCTISGDTNFGTVVVNKPGNTVTFNASDAFTVRDMLRITDGNVVTTSSSVTLLASYDISDGWNTAFIDGTGTGTISAGDITVQQVVGDYDVGKKTWHLVSSPVHLAGSPNYWPNTMLDDNTNQTDVRNSSFAMNPSYGGVIPDWIFYDETTFHWTGGGSVPYVMSGWKGANPLHGTNNTTDALVMQGCVGRFKCYDDGTHCLPLDWTGIPNNGTITSPTLRYTNNSQPTLDGANLLGNPYPSPLDWASVWARLNASSPNPISPIVAIWQNDGGEYTGSYLTFNADDYSGDFDGVIAIGQGFFISTDTDNITIDLENSDRVNNNNVFFFRRGAPPLSFKIKLEGLGNKDITSVMMGNRYSSSFKRREDGPKMMNPGNSIYTKAGQDAMSLNYTTPPDAASKSVIPLEVALGQEGQFTLLPVNFNVEKEAYTIVFEDRQEKKFVAFDDNFHYGFHGTQGANGNRFFLHVLPAGYTDNTLGNLSPFNCFYANGNIYVHSAQNARLAVSDMHGRVVYSGRYTGAGGNEAIDASGFSKGIYILSLVNSDGSVQTQKLGISH